MFKNTIFLLVISAGFPYFLQAQTPRLIVPVGHTEYISAISMSPDGKWVLTSTYEDGTKLWDNKGRDVVSVPATSYVNAFSPDGNGNNDTWNIPALKAFSNFELVVYNRVGKVVYQCRNVFIPWDGYYSGSPLDPGSYVYFLKLNDAKNRFYKGNLVIVR